MIRIVVRILCFVYLVLGCLCNVILVDGDSMSPTISSGDYMLSIPLRLPLKGNIVSIYEPSEGVYLCKRVVAVEGDVVNMADGRLYINGVDTAPAMRNMQEYKLGVNEVFILGDNYDNSRDSRVFGLLRTELITDIMFWNIGEYGYKIMLSIGAIIFGAFIFVELWYYSMRKEQKPHDLLHRYGD